MSKIQFDHKNPDIEIVRKVVFEKLKQESDFKQWSDSSGIQAFDKYFEYANTPPSNHGIFIELAREVFWQLIIEGIIFPGMNPSNPNLPWFSRTKHGKDVIESESPSPHDPTGYLSNLRDNISEPDSTTIAYLEESLATYRTQNIVASTVMLGIASERVFLLLCDSLLNALEDGKEKKKFERLLGGFAVKPKLQWLHDKLQSIKDKKTDGFPENSTLMTTAIADLLRYQRNELGHPRETPPLLKPKEAHSNLLMFSSYYETAEKVRAFLSENKV